MSIFIQLTNAYNTNKPLWINPNSITAISVSEYRNETHTKIWVISTGDDPFCVTETPEEIMQLVEMDV